MCADGALKGVPDLEFEYLVLFSFEGKRRFDLYCNVFRLAFGVILLIGPLLLYCVCMDVKESWLLVRGMRLDKMAITYVL
jgi:hypothetical protein